MRGTCLALGIDVCIFRTIPLCVHVLTFEVEIFFFLFFFCSLYDQRSISGNRYINQFCYISILKVEVGGACPYSINHLSGRRKYVVKKDMVFTYGNLCD